MRKMMLALMLVGATSVAKAEQIRLDDTQLDLITAGVWLDG